MTPPCISITPPSSSSSRSSSRIRNKKKHKVSNNEYDNEESTLCASSTTKTSHNNNHPASDIGIADKHDDDDDHNETETKANYSDNDNDLHDLKLIASEATMIEFDPRTGRPIIIMNNENDFMINGFYKISNIPNDIFTDLIEIHTIIKNKVLLNDMVPWAGIDSEHDSTTRLRAFGFLGNDALKRLDISDVKLHAPEKYGQDAINDEIANRKAIYILHKSKEKKIISTTTTTNIEEEEGCNKYINPTEVVYRLCRDVINSKALSSSSAFDLDYLNLNLNSNELIAYQTNLHNGSQYLNAHMDAPLHEGFGKVIVTIAICGSGNNSNNNNNNTNRITTILLIGKASSEEEEQPVWKFHLKDGEGYILSNNARNICLHAVLVEDDSNNDDSSSNSSYYCMRESLNLRFGLHTKKEAENEIKIHYPDLW